MDRAKNWKRLTRTYEAIVFGRGEQAGSPEEAIARNYKNNLTDEFMLPSVIFERGKPIAKLDKNDSLVFYNLRSDRARQFSKLFVAINKASIILDNMPPLDKIRNLYFAAMTDFGPDLDVHTAFPGSSISSTLPMVLHEKKQLYIAESEKYAHVTYFFNGGYADPVGGEERFMVPSPVAESYAQKPEMSADLITKQILKKIKDNDLDFVAVNFANADMVGHSGDFRATVGAVETLDRQIKILAKEALRRDGNLIITADHGNAECMYDDKAGQPNTFHTKNPVPFLLVSEKFKNKKLKPGGVLGGIAPTILDILEIEKPRAMKENSLL